jgi:hypothetical protein
MHPISGGLLCSQVIRGYFSKKPDPNLGLSTTGSDLGMLTGATVAQDIARARRISTTLCFMSIIVLVA